MTRGTQVGLQEVLTLSPTGLSPSLAALPRVPRLAPGLLLPGLPSACPKTNFQPLAGIGLRTTQPARFGLLPFRSPLLGESHRFLFLGVLRCFSSPACPPDSRKPDRGGITRPGLPHSDTPGSKLAWQLPGAFRSPATSFLGSWRQGIHRTPCVASSKTPSRLCHPVQFVRCLVPKAGCKGPRPQARLLGSAWTLAPEGLTLQVLALSSAGLKSPARAESANPQSPALGSRVGLTCLPGGSCLEVRGFEPLASSVQGRCSAS